MAEFPPNLDDGELWLPSDIFLNEVPSKRGLRHHFPSCMEDLLAQRLAALSLLRQRNLSKPNPERFGPVPVQVRCFLENYSSQEYGCHRLCGCKSKLVPKPVYGGSEGFYEFQLRKPVQPQADDVVLETRARVLQKQQNRLQNRPLPSQGRSGFVDGGFPRVSGGTGVFHPRVLNTANIAPNTTTTSSSAFVKKKQGEF
ncbi:hypothetical protein L484_002230 [Morus notabilis]|uniref:Uncharacterized protein n=1 Tax=Morus notabilis TaxID=981085 RepID=W9SQU8_9ROSA|nr:hypothetical protein L484_002230 [Morus notabilis]